MKTPKLEDFIKPDLTKEEIEQLIELAKNEIKEWKKFLKRLTI